jgi:hypothetical protein
MKKAIKFLQAKKKYLSGIKRHNSAIKNEEPVQIQKWKEEGLDMELIQWRCVRFFGDPMTYDKELHDDINKLLKHIKHDCIIKDINENPIKEGELFKFKYLHDSSPEIELIGSFLWSEEELRYNISLYKLGAEKESIPYNSDGIMKDFELIF